MESKNLTDFHKDKYICKDCVVIEKMERQTKRKSLTNSELLAQKVAKKELADSFKCSDCLEFTSRGNYNCFYYFIFILFLSILTILYSFKIYRAENRL